MPTKTEQGDLNQAFGASQGDYPRVIIAPRDATRLLPHRGRGLEPRGDVPAPRDRDLDLLLGEHRSTVDPEAVSGEVPIERGEWVTALRPEDAANGGYKRYALTALRHLAAGPSRDRGAHLRVGHGRPRREGDPHQRRAHERRHPPQDAREADAQDGGRARPSLPAPVLEGPPDAAVTLIGLGLDRERHPGSGGQQLTEGGTPANQLHFKYLHPFHCREAAADPRGLQAHDRGREQLHAASSPATCGRRPASPWTTCSRATTASRSSPPTSRSG